MINIHITQPILMNSKKNWLLVLHTIHINIYLNNFESGHQVLSKPSYAKYKWWWDQRLTETFLRPEIFDSEINITGFSVVRVDRECRVGGGVCLFKNSKIK